MQVSPGSGFPGKTVDAVVVAVAAFSFKMEQNRHRVRREGVDEMRAPIRRCTVSSRVHATHSHTQQPSLVAGIILCTHVSENVDSYAYGRETICCLYHTLTEQMERRPLTFYGCCVTMEYSGVWCEAIGSS